MWKVIFIMTVALGCHGCNRNHGIMTLTGGGGVSSVHRVSTLIIPEFARGQTLTFNIQVNSGPNIDCCIVPSQYVQGKDESLDLKDRDTWQNKALYSQKNIHSTTFKATMSSNLEYKVVFMQTESSDVESQYVFKVTNH